MLPSFLQYFLDPLQQQQQRKPLLGMVLLIRRDFLGILPNSMFCNFEIIFSEFDAGTSNSDTSNNFVIVSGGLESTSTTEPATTTTFEPRTILEDFPNCGIKGSSNRVIGGTEEGI